jgi:hypothetical protein
MQKTAPHAFRHNRTRSAGNAQLVSIKIIIFVVLLLGCAQAFADEWTKGDTERELVYAALLVADWRQTQDISRHSNMEESNEILGEHPGNGKINRYFIVANALQLTIAYALPSEWRKAWQYSGIGFEFAIVRHNKLIGLSMGF